jgi:sirohydrochlorin ferrochelatase
VQTDDLSDAALVLIGHGSTLNAESALPTYQHAEELRRRKIFGQVLEGFWKQYPSLAGVLRGAFAPRVFIVPLFISEGYFTEEVIPRELGFCKPGQTEFARVQQRGDQVFYYCGPVGTHESMTNVVLSRAREVVEKFPFPQAPKPKDITLFIAGHGTGNNENSRKAIERQAELIRARNLYAGVEAIFMDEEPRIASCQTRAKTKNVVVIPFFISDGMHAQEDIPVLLGEQERLVRERLAAGRPIWRNPTERRGKLVWYTPSIGNEPHLADVILESVREVVRAQEPLVDHVLSFGAELFYISQSDKGGLVFGGHIDGFNSYTQRGQFPKVQGVAECAVALMPCISRLRLVRHWGGIMDMTPDGSPFICKTPVQNLYLNGGWCYQGFKATPASGWCYAHTIAKDDEHDRNHFY